MEGIRRYLSLIVAIGLLIAAAVRPVQKAADYEARRSRASAQVEALRRAAMQRRVDNGVWPTPSSAGEIPPEVLGAFPGDSVMAGEGYTLEWDLIGLVASSEAPPAVELPPQAIGVVDSLPPIVVEVVDRSGVIHVRSDDPRILAALLDEYRGAGAFVRDSTWSLVVPPAS